MSTSQDLERTPIMATMSESTTLVPTPLTIIRAETVLSRFPIHTLSKTGGGTIHIRKNSPQGTLDTRWEVSYNARYGPPRQLAYKLDTLVINQKLDALGRPLPTIIKLGSFAHICSLLGVDDGGGTTAAIKKAFYQNVGAYIVATLRYQSNDGRTQTLDTAFHRYSVVLTGEQLPNGAKADAVYLLLDELYRRVLNHVSVRPLDYDYLKALPPMPQRFYELVSFKFFAALRHGRSAAKLGYAEYCLFAPQQRYTNAIQVQKQMYKVHWPHVDAGYITKVQYEAITDADGQPDWLLHYTPGEKARAEYAAFRHQPAERPHPQAEALVQQFYQRFHGLAQVTPTAKELTQATALLTTHGWEKTWYLLTFSHRAAQATRYDPQVFGGILHYTDRALAAYDARAAQGIHGMPRLAAVDERAQCEQYR